MHTFVAGGKTVTVLPASVPDAPVVYLNTFGDEGQNVFDVLASGGCTPLSLVAISVLLCLVNHAPFYGIGVGTVLTAVFIGRIIKVYEKFVPLPEGVG